MNKTNKTDKWINYFNEHKIFPDCETAESADICGSFGQDFCSMNTDEKNLLWNAIRDLKYKPNINRNNINEILSSMYSRVQQFSHLKLTGSLVVRVNDIFADLMNSKLVDCSELIRIVPDSILSELLFCFKIIYWREFIKLNNYNLNQKSKVNVLDNSKIFGLTENIDYDSTRLKTDKNGDFDLFTPIYISRYIKKYGIDLYKQIMKDIEVHNNYLFCPDMIYSIIDQASFIEKQYIFINILDTESTLNNLEKNGFMFPDIFNENITSLRNVVYKKINDEIDKN